MKSDLPEDLDLLKSWADEAVNAAWTLWSEEDSKRLNAARNKLIELHCNPPEILPGLCRELTIASERSRGKHGVDHTRFGGVPAKHPCEAIKELSWQILARSLFNSRWRIELKIALARESARLGQRRPWGLKRWEEAVASLEQIEKDRDKLADNLAQFKSVIEKFPCAAGSRVNPLLPPPTTVLRPNDDISMLLGIVLNRVWEKRIPKAKASSDSDARVGSAAKNNKRSRTSTYDKDQDAQIYKQWKSRDGQIRTYAEFAEQLGMTEKQVKQAIDRHRKRIKLRK